MLNEIKMKKQKPCVLGISIHTVLLCTYCMMCVWRSYSQYDDIRITPLWILDGAHQVGVGFQSKLRLTHKSDLFPESFRYTYCIILLFLAYFLVLCISIFCSAWPRLV